MNNKENILAMSFQKVSLTRRQLSQNLRQFNKKAIGVLREILNTTTLMSLFPLVTA